MSDKEKDELAEQVIHGLLALQPPGPDVTDPVEWAKLTTLLAEQLYKLIKMQHNMLQDLAAILVQKDSPYASLLATNALCLMALVVSGKSLLKHHGTEPLNLLDEQKKKAREMLSDDAEIPEELRNALLKLLGTEESTEDEAFFPKDGITIEWDGKVH